MSSRTLEAKRQQELRLRALSRLTGANADAPRASASAALGVLHQLASSPSTAADALALLHELQVHQVEVDLQDEELRESRAELEAALVRQIQLYDFAPVGCFTVDAGSVMCELNLAGARMLGHERDALLGRALEAFLAPESGRELRAMLARVAKGQANAACELKVMARDGASRTVRATAGTDPAGPGFLLGWIEIGERAEATGR